MDFYPEMKKTKEYDVIIAGSGPAGMAAAIMAGRQGAKTLIVESLGRLGGISTSGMMSHFTGNVGNKLYHEVLENGLTVYVIPKKDVNNIYVTFTTKYGSNILEFIYTNE